MREGSLAVVAVRDGIADHGATLADYHPRGSVPEGVITVYDAGGGNPDTPTGGAGDANGIAPHDPVGDYATFARDAPNGADFAREASRNSTTGRETVCSKFAPRYIA